MITPFKHAASCKRKLFANLTVMPNIQETRQYSGYTSAVISPVSGMPPVTLRTTSTGSSMSGVNGANSPHSSLAVNCQSPSSTSANSMAQQLPPACGARQLSKLKRFLTTLQQFGMDMSPEIGEHVRGLVLALVNSHLTVEEFHAKLQQATNFPLRPFVIPFMKANLPLLQRELLHCAHLAKQSPHQYMIHNERLLFDADNNSPPLTVQELSDITSDKRKSPERAKEKPLAPDISSQPSKRPRTRSPVSTPRVSMAAPPTFAGFPMSGSEPCRFEDVSLVQDLREINRIDREQMEMETEDKRRQTDVGLHGIDQVSSHIEKMDDYLKHIESMLSCIVEMVDKCKTAITGLREQCQPYGAERLSSWTSNADNVRLRSDDPLVEVNRRAAEAVNEVKRKALLELQKAMAESEAKASHLLATERAKMELAVAEARKQAMEEMVLTFNSQQESTETCWNCGRKASETCSGCNIARYCGSFCQHKDWEHHHKICNQMQSSSSSSAIVRGHHHHLDSMVSDKCSSSRPSTPRVETQRGELDDDANLDEPVRSSRVVSPVARSSPLDMVKCETLN